MLDQMLSNPWIVISLRILIVFGFVLGFVPFLVWIERRVLALFQLRYGPNRVGPAGSMQSFADGIKLFFKEDIIPSKVDYLIYYLAPTLFLTTSLAATAVIPWGFDKRLSPIGADVAGADVNIGILFLLGMASLTTYGIIFAGWASNNKYSLLGGLRGSAQTISYELSMGLTVVAVVLMTGSLSMRSIVDNQAGWFTNWHFLRWGPLGLISMSIYLISMLAETNRAPFDLPEAETELIGGYHTEYSSMKFAMYFMGEYANMIIISAIMVCLFFGGWYAPIPALNFIPGPIWFVAKLFFFLYLFIWIRSTMPRMRFDMLMRFGWIRLLPLSLVNLFVVAICILLWGGK